MKVKKQCPRCRACIAPERAHCSQCNYREPGRAMRDMTNWAKNQKNY